MLDILLKRRSIRKYKEELVSEEKINKIINAMQLAPSGKNTKPCSFIYIDDKDIITKLADSKAGGAGFLKGTYQCIVILGDESKTDTWIEDASIAVTIGHLMATSLKVGSCWIQIRNRKTAEGISSEEFVSKLLNIPEHLKVEAILSLGIADEEKSANKLEYIDNSNVYKNTYGGINE